MAAFQWDDREWMRDELLLRADEEAGDWLFTLQQRQRAEVQRTLKEILRLSSQVKLSKRDRQRVDAAVATLRRHLEQGEN